MKNLMAKVKINSEWGKGRDLKNNIIEFKKTNIILS